MIKFVVEGDYTTAGEADLSDEEYEEFFGDETTWHSGKYGPVGVGELARYIHDSMGFRGGDFVILIGEEHYED